MTNVPMISIIIPIYNQSKELDNCLYSIKSQTYKNYEIIVVNDRSTQPLSRVMKKHKNIFGIKLEYMNNQTNHGAPYSRNKGLKRAKGEFVLFCDADVVMENNMLDTMVDALRLNKDVSYAYGSFKYGYKLFPCWPFDEARLKKMPFIHTTSLIRKEHIPAGGFDEKITRLQDWDLWLTMLEEGHKGVFIDKVLFKIQGGGHTMSAWVPTVFYRLFPFLSKVKKYNKAMAVIKGKHKLPL